MDYTPFIQTDTLHEIWIITGIIISVAVIILGVLRYIKWTDQTEKDIQDLSLTIFGGTVLSMMFGPPILAMIVLAGIITIPPYLITKGIALLIKLLTNTKRDD